MSAPALAASSELVLSDPSQLVDVEVTGPLTATFNGAASGGTPPYTYAWDFGDGTTGTGASVTHTYSANGTYVVVLTATDSAGAKVPVPLTVAVGGVAPPPLAASATASPPSGAAPLDTTLNGSATGGSPPYTYSWDLGDGNTAQGATATHVYNNPGTYDVVLTVTDSSGATAKVPLTVTVSTAAFSAELVGDPVAGPGPLTVKFVGTITGGVGPYRYWLSFGDDQHVNGTIDGTTIKASHIYSGKVKFRANLNVVDANGQNINSNGVWITLT